MIEDLKIALSEISDTYEDFETGVINLVKDRPDDAQKVLEYIREDPDCTTSDVLDYLETLEI